LDTDKLTLKEYLASSVISLGVILILMELTLLFFSSEAYGSESASLINTVTLVFILIHVFGSLVGSLVLAIMTFDKPVHIGLVNSLLTYLMEYVVFFFIKDLGKVGLIILIALMVGSFSGVIIAKKVNIKRNIKNPS
jgi:hypothetical protein